MQIYIERSQFTGLGLNFSIMVVEDRIIFREKKRKLKAET